MVVIMQRNVLCSKKIPKVPDFNKTPLLQEESATVEIKNIDLEERNAKSVVVLFKPKSNVKRISLPANLNKFSPNEERNPKSVVVLFKPKSNVKRISLPANLNKFSPNEAKKKNLTKDSKIEHSKVPCCKESLSSKAIRKRKSKNKSTKVITTKVVQAKEDTTKSDAKKACIHCDLIDDVDELLALIATPEKPTKKPKSIKRISKILKTDRKNTKDLKKDEEKNTYCNQVNVIYSVHALVDLLAVPKESSSFRNDTKFNKINNSKGKSVYLEIHTIHSDPDIKKKIPNQPKFRMLNAQGIYVAKVPKPRNILENVCTKCKFLSLNAPRDGKPLAVIDLDVIIYYFKPDQRNYEKLTPRASVHNFLATLYDHYNLAIWVKTPMHMLFMKLNCLEIITKKQAYKISFCLDKSSVINSYIPRLGNPTIKPLEVIWSLYPQFNVRNTILIDDQRNKFCFNSRFALQVQKCQKMTLFKDHELVNLTMYLINLAKTCGDFSKYGVRITSAYLMTKRD